MKGERARDIKKLIDELPDDFEGLIIVSKDEIEGSFHRYDPTKGKVEVLTQIDKNGTDELVVYA